MSVLRPELGTSSRPAMPDDTALFLILDSVSRRDMLLYGHLHSRDGMSCAIGTFFDDNPKAVLRTALIDEVAAVNDSDPKANPKQRWLKVRSWLRWKIRRMTNPNAPMPKRAGG